MSFDLNGKRVWVAGHRGLVGSALARRLAGEDCVLLTADRSTVDLHSGAAVEEWMAANRPQAVFLAAAKVGGILANKLHPADFLYQNLMIELRVPWGRHRRPLPLQPASRVYERAIFLGKSGAG